ncbi:phosphatidylserine decarboxylase [candidate division KSB1 bacterium]|nr:phosphatidylserine decarboxylase [candidate division KSB1 bacterium]
MKQLNEWIETDVKRAKERSIKWLSEEYFFRDPARPYYINQDFFFSPADGIILYQKIVRPDESLVEIKGKHYTLQTAMHDSSYEKESLVIGIFMTFYDIHVNRIPLGGYLSYQHIEPIASCNRPMLNIEKDLISHNRVNPDDAEYLFYNERMLNTVYSPSIQQSYYILQIGDYDVGVIVPFTTKQHHAYFQNRRFSQIRYGSQVDLIIPLSDHYEFEVLQTDEVHVEAGVDPLIKIHPRGNKHDR